MISKSGCFAPAPELGERIFTGNRNSQPLPRACLLIGVQRTLKELCGSNKEREFWKLMTSNPERVSQSQIKTTQACADALLSYWYVSQESPVSLFQQALITPSQ